MVKTLKNLIGRNRIVTSIIIVVPFLFLAHPSVLSLSIGLPIIFFGETIRVYASGYIRKDKEITMEGPYSMSRNPLYVGNFFLGLGFAIASGNVFIPIIFIMFFFFVYQATIEQEEAFLSGKFGELYLRYKARTPKFFPTFSSLKNPLNPVRSPHEESNKNPEGIKFSNSETSNGVKGAFHWDLVKKHREYNTWIGIVLGIALLAIKLLIA